MQRQTTTLSRSRGFTLVELVAVTLAGAVVIFIALPMLGKSSCGGAQMRDSTQVRGLLQALIIHSQNNQDRFPLPSVIDANNDTIALQGENASGTAKDHTANIFSMLIADGSISTEILISPQEANPSIAEYEGYEFDEPVAAANPSNARWDPAFTVDFINGEGATSYAHSLPGGTRKSLWSNTFDATQPVIGNRGPQISSVTYKGSKAKPAFNKASNTLLIHGKRNSWEGNIGYADNHVAINQSLTPDSAKPFTDAGGTLRPDAVHYNEPNDPTDLNAFLGIFTTGGDTTKDFTAIWD